MADKLSKTEMIKDIEKLKSSYESLKKKYSLPEFKFLNENFEIENIDPDSEILLKVIRKHATEKIFYILRTLETFMNPSNAPLFIFNIIKLLNNFEKELIKKLYNKIVVYEVEAFGLEAEYDEKNEAEFVKRVSHDWKNISSDLKRIYSAMKIKDSAEVKKSEKSYFG
jgi:hypothetical protein